MGVINFLSFILISVLLILELYLNFYRPELLKKEVKEQPKQEKIEKYYLTLPADLNFAEKLLKEGIVFSYSPEGIFITVNSSRQMEELLKDYKTYIVRKQKENTARRVVIAFIKKDLEMLNKEYREAQQDYQKLYNIFTSRGIKVNFEIVEPQILEVQRKTYEGYKQYWDQKLEQIKKDYSISVKKPSLNLTGLLTKARSIYTDELKFNLFQIYLNLKILEANMAADLYKLKEFSSRPYFVNLNRTGNKTVREK